jgi:hypothetical protein
MIKDLSFIHFPYRLKAQIFEVGVTGPHWLIFLHFTLFGEKPSKLIGDDPAQWR